MIGLATRVWQHAGLAGHTSDALAKLTAAGVEIDRTRLDIAAPVVTVQDPHFDVFWHASLDRARVPFDYQRSGAGELRTRTLEPWGVVSFSGRWYAVGRDVDREEERLFRFSRVQRGPPDRQGRCLRRAAGHRPARPYQRPDRGRQRERHDPGPHRHLPGHAPLRDAADEGVSGPDGANGWDRLAVAFSSPYRSRTRSSRSARRLAEAPAEVRKTVVERLIAAPEVSHEQESQGAGRPAAGPGAADPAPGRDEPRGRRDHTGGAACSWSRT